MNHRSLLILLGLGAGAFILHAETPTVIEYAGRVAVDGENFTSTPAAPGYFKCILVTGGGDTIWSHDGVEDLSPAGSSANGGSPSGAIELKPGSSAAPFAVNGQFVLRLGGEYNPDADPAVPPNPIKAKILDDAQGNVRADVFLRVWFSPDGAPGSYEKLIPDVPLGSVPYAIWAARAERVKKGGITPEQFRDGGIGSTFLSPGYDPNATIEDPSNPGQFIPDPIRTDPDKSLNIAGNMIGDEEITGAQLADASVTMSKVRPAFYQGQWADLDPSRLTLDLGSSEWTATVDFDRAFGDIPSIVAPGWTLTDAGGSGFTASHDAILGFVPQAVSGGGDGGEYSALTVVNQRPAISYFDLSSGELRYAWADDAIKASSWRVVTVGSAGSAGPHTSLVVADGHPAISYYNISNGDLEYVRADDEGGTSWGTPVTVDGAGDVGLFTSMALVGGRPAISYLDLSNGKLKYAISDDAGGTNWPISNIVPVDDAGFWPSLEVVGGRPAISYHDAINSDLKYVRADDASGMDWGPPLTVDSVGDVGRYTSLEVVDGRPAIAYVDLTNNALKYVIADDASGTTWGVPVTLDDAVPGVTEFADLSLAVVLGRPAVSYTDSSSGVKLAVADGASGTGVWTVSEVDSPTSVGRGTSLVEVAGRPAISYQGASTLKFATIAVPVGQWTARDPGQDPPVVAARATGVVDGVVTSASFADDVGVWSRSGTDVFREAGNVGIGTANPVRKLHVEGAAGNNTGVWSQFSDRRLKENIVPLAPGALDQLLRLRGVSYDYLRPELRKGFDHPHCGWIAQEVEEVFPEWVSEGPDGMKMVTPVGFRALTVEALRDLRDEKDAVLAELETKNAKLERERAEMRKCLEELEEAFRETQPMRHSREILPPASPSPSDSRAQP